MGQMELARVSDERVAEKAADESVGTKLYREAELLWDGTKKGVSDAVKHAIDHPGESALKVGVSALIGLGLGLAQGRAGLFRLGAQVVGGALGYSFYRDVWSRAEITHDAIVDTWRTDKNLARNKEVIAGTFGPFIVDGALMTAGGMAGARISRIPAVYNSFHHTLDKLTGIPMLEQQAALRQRLFEHDPYTARHGDRVGDLSREIATGMKEAPGTIEAAELAGRMHDVGKANTPLEVLNKNGTLTEAEWKIMQQHAADSRTMLATESTQPRRLRDLPEIAGAHHERLDGRGYPDKLSGDQIKLPTRINSVADIFDALATERPYKAERPLGDVYDALLSNKGRALDPRVVDSFLSLSPDRVLPTYSEYRAASGGRGVPALLPSKGLTMGELMRANPNTTLTPILEGYFASKYGVLKGH